MVPPYGDDITEAIPYTLSNPPANSAYSGSTVAYDIAIAGQPFFLETSDDSPYRRVTAQYRKQQIDQTREPGEQTLTGWWIRSQSTFHLGQGIKFFEPAQDESLRFQYTYSKGCNVWTKGQVTLLHNVNNSNHYTTSAFYSNTRPFQYTRGIQWNGTDGILLHDGYDLNKIDLAGNDTQFQDYTAGTDDPVYSVCDDGVYAYWVTNDTASGKLEFNKKLLTADHTTAPTVMFTQPGITVTNAVLEYTKERIVAAINNKVYEITTSATSLPTAVYTHPDQDVIFTAITSSGAAIYISAFSGIQSNIYKFTLTTAGAMPTLTSAITAAEMPVGEKIFNIGYYLDYLIIGTNLGLRIAEVSNTDGSIAYGPLLFESEQPVYDFDFYDKYIYAATNVDGNPGLTRVDLGTQIGSNLVFAYAWDLYDPSTTGRYTTAVSFAGETNRLMFTTNAKTVGTSVTYKQLTSNVATLTTSTAHGLTTGDSVWVEKVDNTFNGRYIVTGTPTTTTFTYAKTASNVALTAVSPAGLVNLTGKIYIEDDADLVPSAEIRTGFVRYNTLENKIFKVLTPRFNATNGGIDIYSVQADDTETLIGAYVQGSTITQVGIPYPSVPVQYLGFKFVFSRSSTDATLGPIFTGYQVNTLPSIPRQRLIQYPAMCYDYEMDKFNNQAGYEGAAYNRQKTLESIEDIGDTVLVQDFRTGESFLGLIEEQDFINKTPTDKRFSGYGGVLLITIRKV